MHNKKVNILHFVHSLNEGGIERLLLEICNKIDNQKFEIQICCLVEKGNLAGEFEKSGIKLHVLNAERDFKLNHIPHNISVIRAIVKILKDEKIDITHGHEFFSTVFSRISSVLAGVKKRYITLHNVYLWWGKGVHSINKMLSYVTTGIICNSKATMNYSIEHDKINKNKYILIYNGIDSNKFKSDESGRQHLLKQLSIPEDSVVFMAVGNISHRKGYEYLIKGFKDISLKYTKVILVIAGGKHYKEEDYFDKIQKLINELRLNKIVIFTDIRSDVEKLLNICDIYVMASVAEGFGLALAEAMATERVCVASDIDPFKEIVDDGKDGFLFKTQNPASLAGTVEKVLGMGKDELEKIKLNARRKIIKEFSSDEMVRKYEELYSK